MSRYERALKRLNHWGMLLTGRIAGTLREDDPRSKGYRDLFQKLLFLRAEVTVLTSMLLELTDTEGQTLFSVEDVQKRLTAEAEQLCRDYEARFPGWRTTDEGLQVIDVELAKEAMKGWPQ